MPTSELSDALNPYYAHSRSRSGQHAHSTSQPSPQPAPQHTHLAMGAPETPSTPLGSRPPTQTNRVTAVQELLRFLASTREACEIERRRRLSWEREMEAKHTLQKAEMERRIFDLQQQVTSLRSCLPFYPASSDPSTGTSDLHPAPSPAGFQQSTPTVPFAGIHSSAIAHSVEPAPLPTSEAVEPPSTRFIPVDPTSCQGNSSSGRKSATLSESDEDNSDVSSSFPQHRLRRRNHHDNRCLTIQHAMRNHLLRVMQLDSDKQLPDSHVEGTPLGPDESVRFVWDKTPKQSVHNSRMKERVLKDLKANRRLYRHVPDKEFGKKSLESAFDQAFVTLRQKFKAQRDASVAKSHKQREDIKAMRARRLSRRKVKLGNRSEARNRMQVFEHITFDGALQLECMSSEESEVEEDPTSETRTVMFRVRGYQWRSLRLQHFFDALDREEREANAQRPRRGVGRKERYRGPTKEGVLLPPKGVASWMISKRWMTMIQASHPEVHDMLKDIIVDTEALDWNQVPLMSVESDEEGWMEPSLVDDNFYTTHRRC
ncbi:hypothetical protein V8B97DRAFT_1924192 [Scleroderma yunnanense]